jgi:ABC-type transporter Mla maintaining outer membrane lipid asymmetry ATPase subunit MlaF
VRRGEAVGLLGPNGAGKTTCFYMITGLVPVDSGSIEIDGHDVSDLPMYRRARLGVGYLPQEASIFRGLSVEANIRAVLEVVRNDRAKREHKLDSLLEEFHISHLRKSASIRFQAASGGVWKSPVRLRPIRPSCCSTNPLPASIRSRCPTFRIWSASDPPRHRGPDHRSQCARDPWSD